MPRNATAKKTVKKTMLLMAAMFAKGIGAGNKAVVEAVDHVKAVNASKAAKAINVDTEVEGLKAIKNTKGDINLYAIALIYSINVHEDATDATITAENTKKGHATVSTESADFPSNSR
jgi:hypothetical protein